MQAAILCEEAGADGITVHLRQDRRHIQDEDVRSLRSKISTYLNLEHAVTEEMLRIAESIKPDAVSLVPESPNEITTEGGLNIINNREAISAGVERLKKAGIHVSIFIDPVNTQIDAAIEVGADQIEICTAEYADLTLDAGDIEEGGRTDKVEFELDRIRTAAKYAAGSGLIVAAGHGLTTNNVKDLASIPEISEFNIGHHIISRAIFVGLEKAVNEMLAAMKG